MEMPIATPGADFASCALIIVDMQNDFLHKDGSFGIMAREQPEATIDMPFLAGTIPKVQRLADAFRAAGRPVVYVAHVLRPDYSDAAFPYWRVGIKPGEGNRTHCVEGTWGAQVVDELRPHDGENLVVKKGFGGFAGTPLDTILRNLSVNTCVAAGVTTCVCVSNTVRGGVEHNYRMVIAEDGVAEANRQAHAGELLTMQRLFADVLPVDAILTRLREAGR
jgi:ureidoacrylate peracid hydrolase